MPPPKAEIGFLLSSPIRRNEYTRSIYVEDPNWQTMIRNDDFRADPANSYRYAIEHPCLCARLVFAKQVGLRRRVLFELFRHCMGGGGGRTGVRLPSIREALAINSCIVEQRTEH